MVEVFNITKEDRFCKGEKLAVTAVASVVNLFLSLLLYLLCSLIGDLCARRLFTVLGLSWVPWSNGDVMPPMMSVWLIIASVLLKSVQLCRLELSEFWLWSWLRFASRCAVFPPIELPWEGLWRTSLAEDRLDDGFDACKNSYEKNIRSICQLPECRC